MPPVQSSIVEVCVFKMVNGRPQYLLLQRSQDDSLYPGIWQFVTGSLEKEEHTVAAARREVQEETGLAVKRFWVVPFVNSFYDAAHDAIQIASFFAAEVNPTNNPQLSHEHQSFAWYDVDGARLKLVWPGQRQGLLTVHEFIVNQSEAAQLTEIQHHSV